MGALLALLLPALVPVVADGTRAIINRMSNGKGALPSTVDEQIRLATSEIEKMKVIAEMDRPAVNISPWVADLRASFRYIACAAIILYAMIVGVMPSVDIAVKEFTLQLAGSAFAFIFGDRMYMRMRK